MEILLKRHPYLVIPLILGGLDHVPETVAPQQFESIIKSLSETQQPPSLERERDWVEAPPVLSKIQSRVTDADTIENLTDYTWQFCFGWSPPTVHQICAWAQKRAFAVDRITGQLDRSIQYFQLVKLMECGADQESIAQAGYQLQSLLRAAVSRSENAWMYDLFTFQTLDEAGRIEKVLTLMHEDSLVADIQGILLPFLRCFGAREGGLRPLSIALQRSADSKFPLIVEILRIDSSQRQLFESSSQLCRVALAFIYSCRCDEHWPLVESLLYAVRDCIHEDSSLDHDQSEALLKMLDAVSGQLFAANMFTKHGLPLTLAQIRDASHSETVTMLRTMLSRYVRSSPAESMWKKVWEDVVAAQQRGLSSLLNEEDVRIEFVRAMLRCGHLRTAKLYISVLSDFQQESLVLEGAQDAFYSSDTPDDSTAQLVTQVLSLLPHSKAAQEEVSFVSAAVQLKQLGVDLPPLAVRQEPDKAAILQRAIKQASMTALLDTESFLKLSVALQAHLTEVEVLLMMAKAALEAGSHRYCETLLLRVATSPSHHHADGWSLAYSLIKSENGCTDDHTRRQLMVYVMKYAPVDALLDVVQCWKSSIDDNYLQVSNFAQGSSSLDLQQIMASIEGLLSTWLETNNREATGHDCMVLVNKLLTLGPDGPAVWAESLETQISTEYRPASARYAFVAGLLAASVQALSLLSEHGDKINVVPEVYMMLVEHWTSYTPLYLTDTALSGISSRLQSTAPLDGEIRSRLEKYRNIIISLAKGMEAAADYWRIEKLLRRSNHGAGVSKSDVGISSQPELICHLATVLAKENVSGIEADVTLQDIVSLGRRNGVDEDQVYLAYAVAFLVECCHQDDVSRRPPKLQTDMDQQAWQSMMLNRPVQVLQAIHQEVLPGVLESRRTRSVVWIFELCSEVCRACGQLTQQSTEEGATPMAEYVELFKVAAIGFDELAMSLQCSIDEISVASMDHRDNNVGGHLAMERSLVLFARPIIQLIFAAVGIAPLAGEDSWQKETEKLLCHVSEMMALGEQEQGFGNEQILLHIVQDMSSQYSKVLQSFSGRLEEDVRNKTYPLDLSSVHLIALCRQLIAISQSRKDQISEVQRQRLQNRFEAVSLKEAVDTAAYACLGKETALECFFQQCDNNVLSMSSHQCQTILEVALSRIDRESNLPNQSIVVQDAELQVKIGILRKEAFRLAAISYIETKCHMLNERQLQEARELVVRLQAINEPNGRADSLHRFLSKLFADGCSVTDIYVCASACEQLLDQPTDPLALVTCAGEQVVQRSVSYMTASNGALINGEEEWSSFSYGDAVQHVYGVIRALNDDTTLEDILTTDDRDSLRSKIWHVLHSYAVSEHSAVTPVAVEARVQLLEMIGSLGQNMWLGWSAPTGSRDGPLLDHSHKNALLYSRVAAILVASWQESLEIWASVSSDVFTNKNEMEAIMVRLIDAASTLEELLTLIRVLTDVIEDVFPKEILIVEEYDAPESSRELQISPLHQLWFKSLKGLLEREALTPALRILDFSVSKDIDALINETEAEVMISNCQELGGNVYGAAVACMLPYKGLQVKYIELFTDSLDNAEPLLLEAERERNTLQVLGICALDKDLFGTLCRGCGNVVVKGLCTAVLDSTQCWGGISHNNEEVKDKAAIVRVGLAAAAAVALMEHSMFSAAAWLAMQHAGVHPLLRLIDSAPHVLKKLLNAVIINEGSLGNMEFEFEEAESILVPNAVQKVLRRVPDKALHALNKLV